MTKAQENTMQKTISEIKKDAVAASLQLAKTSGWGNVSMREIAQQAQVSLAQLHDVFDSKECILNAYGKQVDAQILDVMGAEMAQGESVKDRLFDVLMERFEVLNKDREAVLSILHAMGKDPKQLLYTAPFLCRSMTWMMELAGQKTSGWCGAARIAGLTGVYMRAVFVWMRDDSPDMPKTMAVLDKSLSQADQLASWLKL